jgi:hypothetical protein
MRPAILRGSLGLSFLTSFSGSGLIPGPVVLAMIALMVVAGHPWDPLVPWPGRCRQNDGLIPGRSSNRCGDSSESISP